MAPKICICRLRGRRSGGGGGGGGGGREGGERGERGEEVRNLFYLL